MQILLAGFLATFLATAARAELIYVRAKVGVSVTNAGSGGAVGAFGGDVGTVFENGLGVAAVSTFNLSGPLALGTSAVGSSYFLGVGPTFTANSGIAGLTFGLALGAASGSGSAFVVGQYIDVSSTRFAFAPYVALDLSLGSVFFLSAALQYVASVGGSNLISFVSPSGGFGFRF